MDEYQSRKRRERIALAAEDLSDAEIDAIGRTEPPAEAAQYNCELKAECGRDR